MYYDLLISLKGPTLTLEVLHCEMSCLLDSREGKISTILEGSYSLYKGVRETFFKGEDGYSRPVSLEKVEGVEIIRYARDEIISLEYLEDLLEDFVRLGYITQDEAINEDTTVFLVKRGEATSLRKAFNRIQG